MTKPANALPVDEIERALADPGGHVCIDFETGLIVAIDAARRGEGPA